MVCGSGFGNDSRQAVAYGSVREVQLVGEVCGVAGVKYCAADADFTWGEGVAPDSGSDAVAVVKYGKAGGGGSDYAVPLSPVGDDKCHGVGGAGIVTLLKIRSK